MTVKTIEKNESEDLTDNVEWRGSSVVIIELPVPFLCPWKAVCGLRNWATVSIEKSGLVSGPVELNAEVMVLVSSGEHSSPSQQVATILRITDQSLYTVSKSPFTSLFR
ncbi:unnamed protein product [Schistocephalus solidus]|uniref:Uncharacterized protein n=1 Tax=Schistocephalus solidus TaxID=70667 RepID=A0A183T3P1_SCHSO|nr:unnamed protein product [Schistocephalus solidus]